MLSNSYFDILPMSNFEQILDSLCTKNYSFMAFKCRILLIAAAVLNFLRKWKMFFISKTIRYI